MYLNATYSTFPLLNYQASKWWKQQNPFHSEGLVFSVPYHLDQTVKLSSRVAGEMKPSAKHFHRKFPLTYD